MFAPRRMRASRRDGREGCCHRSAVIRHAVADGAELLERHSVVDGRGCRPARESRRERDHRLADGAGDDARGVAHSLIEPCEESVYRREERADGLRIDGSSVKLPMRSGCVARVERDSPAGGRRGDVEFADESLDRARSDAPVEAPARGGLDGAVEVQAGLDLRVVRGERREQLVVMGQLVRGDRSRRRRRIDLGVIARKPSLDGKGRTRTVGHETLNFVGSSGDRLDGANERRKDCRRCRARTSEPAS